MTVSIVPASTPGKLAVWGGTQDGKDGYIDYEIRASNLIPPHEVYIVAHDVRLLSPRPTFDTNGYELLRQPTQLSAQDFLASSTPEGKALVESTYYGECMRLVQRVTGGTSVHVASFRVRQDPQPEITSTPKIQVLSDAGSHGPRPVAHIDRDPTTFMTVLHDTLGEERGTQLMRTAKRWAQVNVWRPIQNNAQRWPLCFMNHDRIPDWDYAEYTGRIRNFNDPRVQHRGEKTYDCLVKEDSRYSYHYARDMSPDEVWVFSSFDSDVHMVQPHSAFWDMQTPPDAPPRRSIEVRTLVFW